MQEATMTQQEQISLAFMEVVKLAEALGVSHVNQLPACWEYKVDDNWFIALNGHQWPTKCGSGFYVEWCGFPAGEFSPYGGFIAVGSEANEEALITALKRATEAATVMRRPGIQNGLKKVEELEQGGEVFV